MALMAGGKIGGGETQPRTLNLASGKLYLSLVDPYLVLAWLVMSLIHFQALDMETTTTGFHARDCFETP